MAKIKEWEKPLCPKVSPYLILKKNAITSASGNIEQIIARIVSFIFPVDSIEFAHKPPVTACVIIVGIKRPFLSFIHGN